MESKLSITHRIQQTPFLDKRPFAWEEVNKAWLQLLSFAHCHSGFNWQNMKSMPPKDPFQSSVQKEHLQS